MDQHAGSRIHAVHMYIYLTQCVHVQQMIPIHVVTYYSLTPSHNKTRFQHSTPNN